MTEGLNRRIAEKLGYRVDVNHYYGNDTYPDRYVLIDPSGELVAWDDGCGDGATCTQFDTEAQAWKYVPDFEHSLDLVVGVLPEDADLFLMRHDKGYILAKLTPRPFDFRVGNSGHFFGEGATRQAAAAEALYAWAQAQSDQKAGV